MTILTAREVAEMLKVSEQTVYRWAKIGKIPSLQSDTWGTVRFLKEDVLASLGYTGNQ